MGGEASPEAVISALNPIAWWKFDEGSGQVAADSSGNGNDLQLGSTSGADANEPTWAAYGIDCTADAPLNYLDAGGDLGISGTDARTVIAVVQIDTSTFSVDNTGCCFFTWLGSGGTGTRWSLRNQSGAAPLRIESGGGGNNSQSFPSLNFADEAWTFVAATQSGAATNTAVAYMNGSSAAYTNVGTNINTSGNLYLMGAEIGPSGADRWGKIAYGLVFDTALTAQQIADVRTALTTILADRGVTLPTDFEYAEQLIEGLAPVGWYKFDEGSGTTVTDYGSAGSDAVVSTSVALSAFPTWVSTGLSFDGTDDTIEAGALSVSGGDARTVVAVVSPGDLGTNFTDFGLGWLGDGANFKRWSMRCASSTDDFRLEVAGAGETESVLNFDAGTWALVAAVQTGNNMNTVTLHKDGSSQALATNQVLDTLGNFLWGFTSVRNKFICAYTLVWDSALSSENLAAVRVALRTILADRGITLP